MFDDFSIKPEPLGVNWATWIVLFLLFFLASYGAGWLVKHI
jgi:hypothetical protein